MRGPAAEGHGPRSLGWPSVIVPSASTPAGPSLLSDDDEALTLRGPKRPAIVACVGPDQAETGLAEHPSPLGQRERLDAKPPLHRPVTAGEDDQLRAVGHLGSGIEATILQDEPVRPGSLPVPPGQRRIVRRIPMVDEQTPAGAEGPGHPAQDRLVLTRSEVSEAREEADHGVELRGEVELPHVAVQKAEAGPLVEAAPRLIEHRAREIHADHAEATSAELCGMASVATRHVENPCGPRQAEAPEHEIH